MTSAVPTWQRFIDGAFVPGIGHHNVFNPADHALLPRMFVASAEQVAQAIDAARRAQPAWAKRTAQDRAGLMRAIAAKVLEHAPHLARTIMLEQGKVASLAEIEVGFTADYLDYMAEWARRIEGEIVSTDCPRENIFLFRKPMDVVAGILPWDFPFFLIARKMAPALLTGNTIVIKPSKETPNNCFEFAKLVVGTYLPTGVFNVVAGMGDVGERLAGNERVDMVSFTGSVPTGPKIMTAAAGNLTPIWTWRSRRFTYRTSSTRGRSAIARSACMSSEASRRYLSSASRRQWRQPVMYIPATSPACTWDR